MPDQTYPNPSHLLSPHQIFIIHSAASLSSEAPARLLRIATLLPCDASMIAKAEISLIDRQNGSMRVGNGGGGLTEVVVGYDAAIAIEHAAAGRRHGPLVVDSEGRALTVDDDTEDYAREIVAEIGGNSASFEWTFALLRESIFADISDYGTPLVLAEAQAGISNPVVGWTRQEMLLGQRAAADWWAYRMGICPPSPSSGSCRNHALRRQR